MIDWTKPIETSYGLSAYVLAHNIEACWICIVVKEGLRADEVFLVDSEGVRCDFRSLSDTPPKPFIRNVKVKREGWVLMRPWSSWSGEPINIVGLLAMHHVYPSEEEAKRATRYFEVEPGTKPVHLTWEE
jgi:hypothetical protein